jgi:hypothetical protein
MGSLAPLIIITGCGGGSGFDPNNVTVTVSPSSHFDISTAGFCAPVKPYLGLLFGTLGRTLA